MKSCQTYNERSKWQQAFSLLEVLVAATVAGLLVVLLNQILVNSNRGILLSSRQLDNASIGRTVFDRIAYDFHAKITQKNTGSGVIKNLGNDELSFFARVRSSSADSRFSKLLYNVESQPDAVPNLLRNNAPVGWDANPVTATNSDARSIGPGVFRIEAVFLGKNGALFADEPSDPDDLRGIVIGIAALDPQLLKLLSDAELTALSGRLADAIDGMTPAGSWKVESFADLPGPVRENVRFYQRVFYVR